MDKDTPIAALTCKYISINKHSVMVTVVAPDHVFRGGNVFDRTPLELHPQTLVSSLSSLGIVVKVLWNCGPVGVVYVCVLTMYSVWH